MVLFGVGISLAEFGVGSSPAGLAVRISLSRRWHLECQRPRVWENLCSETRIWWPVWRWTCLDAATVTGRLGASDSELWRSVIFCEPCRVWYRSPGEVCRGWIVVWDRWGWIFCSLRCSLRVRTSWNLPGMDRVVFVAHLCLFVPCHCHYRANFRCITLQ